MQNLSTNLLWLKMNVMNYLKKMQPKKELPYLHAWAMLER